MFFLAIKNMHFDNSAIMPVDLGANESRSYKQENIKSA